MLAASLCAAHTFTNTHKPCTHAPVADFIEGVLPLLRAPLPRVWDKVEAGGPLAEPLRASVTHYGHPDISGE